MEHFPKDMINLLMTEYFHPFTALNCLTVSKKFFRSVDPTQIRYRAVRHIVWTQDHNRTDNLMLCLLCNCLFNKKNYTKHLDKHRANPNMQYQNCCHSVICNDCGMKFPPVDHMCPLELITCDIDTSWRRGFLQLCDPSVKMPRLKLYRAHKCKMECEDCGEIIEMSVVSSIYQAYRDLSNHRIHNSTFPTTIGHEGALFILIPVVFGILFFITK